MLESYNDLLTVNEVSRVMNCSEQKVRKLIKTGVLKSYRIGRQIRIKKTDLINFIENNPL
jgi:putative molybdopterin biosynthesis protein